MIQRKMINWYFHSNNKIKKVISKIYSFILGFRPSVIGSEKFGKYLEKYCGKTNYQNFIALMPKINV